MCVWWRVGNRVAGAVVVLSSWACGVAVPPDGGPSGDDDVEARPMQPPDDLPHLGAACATAGPHVDVASNRWELRWGGQEWPNENILFEGFVGPERPAERLSFYARVVANRAEGEGRYVELIEHLAKDAPSPDDPDILRIWHTLPDGRAIPLAVDDIVLAELALQRPTSIPQGRPPVPGAAVALWATDQASRDQLIFLGEWSLAGPGLAPGAEHPLFSAVQVLDGQCPDEGWCTGSRPASMAFQLREDLDTPQHSGGWAAVWPGQTAHVDQATLRWAIDVQWAWMYGSPSDCTEQPYGSWLGFTAVLDEG